jgi:hypothetical protein
MPFIALAAAIIITLVIIHREVLAELILYLSIRIADIALLQVTLRADQSLQPSP